MKRLSLALYFSLFFLSAYAHATWTAVQWVTPVRTFCDTQNNPVFPHLPTDYLECTVPLTSALVAGHQVTISFVNNDDDLYKTPRQITYAYACAATGGANNDCNASNNTETIVLHHTTGTDDCRGNGSSIPGGTESTDCATILSTAGGANFITVGRSDNGLKETMDFSILESSSNVGGVRIDSVAGSALNLSTTMPNITALSVTGTDLVVQAIVCDPGSTTAITSPYSGPAFFSAHFGFTYALNIASGAAPIWTCSTSSSSAGAAVAWTANNPFTTASQLTVRGDVAFRGGVITNSPASTIQITSTSPLPNCTQSTAFSFSFNASGGLLPYTWTKASGTLQPGLSLSTGGVLSGSCTNNSGTTTAVIQVCDSSSPSQCAQGSFQQTAQNSPPPTIEVCDSSSSPTCPNPPLTGIVGTFYSYNFSAIGGTPPYAWTVSSGSIPLGLSLTSAGVFSGFPSTLGTYSFTAMVTDSLAATATGNFTVTIAGYNGNPAVALEPQSWVTAYQGGQNLTTGNPCAITDASGACARNLPKLCTSGNNCKHEQLGFGTNDHPATLAGLYQAGCDWTQLGQGNYLWVEVKKTSVLTGAAPYTSSLFGNPAALWVAPVKMAGLSTPMPTGLSCPAATSTPIGPWSIAGSVVGSVQFILGEQVQQVSTLAQASLLYVTCSNGTGTNAPWRNPGSTVLPNCADANDQTGPFSVSMFTGSTAPDSSDEWIGLTSGAVFMPSGAPTANGYFRLTTECDDADTNIPCTGLADQIPCYHSILDSGFVNNPLCSNDLPSMFTIEASTIAVNNSNQIEQDGENTSLSGFEVTIQQGQNQSLPGPACPSGVNCGFSPQLISVDCGACGQDHIWAHGSDPGDPALHAGDPSQLSFSTAHYPVTPGTSPAQYNCPGWAYFSTQPPSASNPPIALSASASAPYNQIQFANGCGDDIQGGIVLNSGGYGWTEYAAVTKIHKNNTETHTIIMGNAADNLNPNGAGINGPYKISQIYSCGASEHLFVGGTPVNPISGIAMNMEIRAYRAGCDPAYRYLTGSSGHSPLASGGYGCGAGTGTVPNLCPEVWAAKKNLELKWCIQCVVNGFLLEMMYPDGQTGEIATMDVRVCSGGDDCWIAGPTGLPLTATNDITISDGIIRNSSGGLTVAPRSGGPGDGGGVSQGQNRVHFFDILLYNFDQNQFGGSKGGDALNWGTSGNTFSNGVATRSGNIASISFPVGTVAPNPLSHIQTCATGPCPGPGSVSIPSGTLYVNFNGQREDPLAPSGTTGPCLSPDNVTVIPCGTVVFSGGTYDSTWNILTGAAGGSSTTSSNTDDSTTGWTAGCVSPCAGAGNPPQAYQGDSGHPGAILINQQPSLDGEAGSIFETSATGGNSDALWVFRQGANDAVTSESFDIEVYPTPGWSELEYDAYQFCQSCTTFHPTGEEYMYGSQCKAGHNWQIWNESAGSWNDISPTISCNLTSNAWNHIQWFMHRDPTDLTGACSGEPCEYYDKLVLNGTTLCNPCGQYPAGANPSGYHNVGYQIQIDIASASTTVTETFDEANFTSTVPGGGTFDCRTLPCLNTQGTTNVWAPMCNAGVGATSMEIGEGCHNCGASGNSPCPPIGCGDVSCVTGAPLSSDTICNGTGAAVGPPPGCGPANSTFQTYAFSILDISPGDIAYITNCSDGTFNTPLAGTPNAYACTAGVKGCSQNQNPVSLTVMYPNTGANVSSGVTGCQVSNAPSWQRNFIADHVGVVTGGQAQLNATLFGIKTQQENNQLTNSYFYFGGTGKGLYCSGNPCTNGEADNPGAGHYSPYQTFDQTTNQIHHNAFMLPTTLRSSYYIAVGLLGSTICPNDPTPGNCTGSSSQPLTPFCTALLMNYDTAGNPLCLGMTGWLDKSYFPSPTYNGTDCTSPNIALCPLISPPWGTFDYHNFALCAGCGGAGSQPNPFSSMGSDGLQLGPCLANSTTNCTNSLLGTSMISIDKALSRKQYVCIGTCGTGPWPD